VNRQSTPERLNGERAMVAIRRRQPSVLASQSDADPTGGRGQTGELLARSPRLHLSS
jgi:hypothetical protein